MWEISNWSWWNLNNSTYLRIVISGAVTSRKQWSIRNRTNEDLSCKCIVCGYKQKKIKRKWGKKELWKGTEECGKLRTGWRLFNWLNTIFRNTDQLEIESIRISAVSEPITVGVAQSVMRMNGREEGNWETKWKWQITGWWRSVGGGVGLIYEARRHRGRVFFNLSAVIIIGFSSRVNDKVRAGSIQTAEPIRAASPVLLLSLASSSFLSPLLRHTAVNRWHYFGPSTWLVCPCSR